MSNTKYIYESPKRVYKPINDPLFHKKNTLKNAVSSISNNKLNSNSIFSSFRRNYNSFNVNNRKNGVNDNSIVFFDKNNDRVYKIALWKDREGNGIINEYKCYKILKDETFVPKMLGCEIIKGTKYALLVISFNKEISKNKILSRNNNLFIQAKNELYKKGIIHNDLYKNCYNINNTFFIIDFENVTFTNNYTLHGNILNNIQKMTNQTYTNNRRSKKKPKYDGTTIKALNFGPNFGKNL